MRHLFTQLGAAVIMLFALTSTATAQALVGLPEFGVTLSGTPGAPVVENHSPQAIIGHVLRVFYANSAIPTNAANFKGRDIWLNRGEGLLPNRTEAPLLKIMGHVKMQVNGIDLANPSRVVLDSVVFANGQVVGPDVIGNFDRLTKRITALKELAALAHGALNDRALQSALWSEVDRAIAQKGSTFELAVDLRTAHNSRDIGSDAFEIADRVANLPTLWRAK